MKERPIIFSSKMVKAILEGRKTMTRRIVKHDTLTKPPYFFSGEMSEDLGYTKSTAFTWAGFRHDPDWQHKPEPRGSALYIKCPYGKPGDRLWVREGWAGKPILNWQMEGFDQETVEILGPKHTIYKAERPNAFVKRWRSPLFIPRWASRITLEVVSVRVERLQDITESDAVAEGIPAGCDNIIIDVFTALWQKINGPGSWDKNPWIWVIEFKNITP